ncbi:D-alanyl-D-alanine-carboxypeptidase/endopeptidase AmpH [Paracoccus seriniphilus]|nr:D-alanyl-D-alanine-carboxypeptidase/endopeptidase AmpH [Paracoccus seriniphilus]WCR14974.1 D-alanyl-D-alanine-carboxypeptidase/endopeptidase AmpH [Paracoccus seriniphilus]
MRQGIFGGMVACAIGLTAIGAPDRAKAEADLLQENVDFAGMIFHLQTGVPGLIVGAVQDGHIAVRGFGETQRGNGVQPDGDTVLRIGSITKAFAGQMLAEAVVRDEVAFTDPVAPLLPGRLGESVAGHERIRLIDLVTHSAGLPREVPREEGPPEDPFATITLDAFADWFDGNQLQFQPGSAISYSNFGFDLLAAALSSAGGAPYSELLAQRITGPLSMDDTGYDPSDAMRQRMMTGHAPDGSPMPDVPSNEVITGSGGLYSTANDLLHWMAWHLTDQEPHAEMRFLDHAVYVRRDGKDAIVAMDESGRMDGMGLGWVAMEATAEHPFILQKAGALQGQMSYIAFAPEHDAAVFVSINQFDFSAAYAMGEFANEFLAQLSGF